MSTCLRQNGFKKPEAGLHAAKLEDNTNDSGCGDENHRMKSLGFFADSGKIVKHCQKDQVGNAHQIQDISRRRISVFMEHDQREYGKSGGGNQAGGCRAQTVKGVSGRIYYP